MLLNYLKLSLRLMMRNPFFTFINVAGLSVGFAIFFILWPFAQSDLKSDQFIPDHEKIVRAISDFNWTDNGGESWGHLNIAATASGATPILRENSAVEDATRFISQDGFSEAATPGLDGNVIVKIENENQAMSLIRLENSICADTNFFEFFRLPFIHGDRKTSLNNPDGIVLSEEKAQLFFGNENPVGRQLRINERNFQVTGVFEDLPANSHLQFDIAFSNISKLSFWNETGEFWVNQYFKMKGDPHHLADLFNKDKARFTGSFLEKNPHIKLNIVAQPLKEIAFSQRFSGDTFKPKSKFMLKVLALVSVVVLVMAWMNYVNLTISRTHTRYKEIAVRKVNGALMNDLLIQFICQSAVVNILAALIGLTLIQIVKLPFDRLLNIHIIPLYELELQSLLFFILVFVGGIVATAGYPTWAIMLYSTNRLLNKNVPARNKIVTILFTITQYSAALALIAWIFIMNSQLNFIMDKDLGIDKENIVVFESPVTGLENNGKQKLFEFVNLVKARLSSDNIAISARVCGEVPWSLEFRRVGSDIFYGIDSHGAVDENFIPTFNLKLISGRNFQKDEIGFSTIISATTSERLGFKSPEESVGTYVEINTGEGWKKIEIIGVIEDYRMSPFLLEEGSTESTTGRGQALVYLNNDLSQYIPQRISVKLTSRDFSRLVGQVKESFDQLFPGNIFTWYFLDDNIQQQYGDQKISRNQITFFTIVAVGVACLGLLGMISNKVAEKTKEISVRRILGAGHGHVAGLLLNSTAVQIGLATLLGLPVAWKLSLRYLEKYTDHIAIQWWHFIIPVLILVSIMLITIVSVLLKAVKNNPVEALRMND